MKSYTLILFALFTFVFSHTSYAQIQVGPLAGFGLNALSINPDVQGRNIDTKPGYTLGATFIYNFSPMFSVQLEPAYTQRGATIYSAQTDIGLILEIEQSVEMNYVDVPVLFKVSFGGDFIKPYIIGGADIGFPLENTKLKLNRVIANGESVIEMVPDEFKEQELLNEGVDFGLNFGAGFSFPISTVSMFFQAQYNLGLSDLNNETPQQGVEQDIIKNRGFQIKTGLLITL